MYALTSTEKAAAIRFYRFCAIAAVAWVILGFGLTFFWPDRPVALWQVGCGVGWLATIASDKRTQAIGASRWALCLRYVGCVAAVSIYVILWVLLLSSAMPSRFAAYIGTLFGCCCVLAGIRGRGFRGASSRSLVGFGILYSVACFVGSALPSGWFAPTCLALSIVGQLALLLAHRWNTTAKPS